MHAKLVFLSGDRRDTTFEVPDGEVTIGRRHDCAVRFPDDARVVSGHHATLFVRDGRMFVRDQASMNGTLVDGRRVTEAQLANGQIITFGANGPSVRVEIAPEQPTTSSAASAPAPAPAPAAARAGTGLTAMYRIARERTAAASDGPPSQTAVFKTFVQLTQEQSNRQVRRLLVAAAGVVIVAVGAVFAFGEWRASRLSAELIAEGHARAAVEQQLSQLAAVAADWQKTASSLAHDLQTSRSEIEQQRRQFDEQRRTVQSDARFGPTVTEKFASGVGLIQVRTGWYNQPLGWLRLRGTSDAKLSFGTVDRDQPAVQGVFYCTGFLIEENGWILTNRHCLDLGYPDGSGKEDEIQLKNSSGTATFTPAIASVRISFPPGRVFDGDVSSVIISKEHDLGAFRTTTRPKGVPALPLARGDAQRVSAGEDVVMLAFPGGADLTVKRRASWVDSSLLDQIEKAEDAAYEQFLRASGTAPYRESVGTLPDDAEKMEALLKSNVGLRVFVSTVDGVEAEAMFLALSRAGQVQPDVSSRMSVSGVQPTSIAYHTLSGVGGASGAPVIGTSLAVVGVNHAGFAHRDRGKQFQQSEAVPIEFAWRFLPKGLAR